MSKVNMFTKKKLHVIIYLCIHLLKAYVHAIKLHA